MTESSTPYLQLPKEAKLHLARQSPAGLALYSTGGRWLPARHLIYLDRALRLLAARRIKRLVVTLPPRHGKTELISKHFPAWYLGSNPSHKVILSSYGATLAHENSRACRKLIKTLGDEVFGVGPGPVTQRQDEWDVCRYLPRSLRGRRPEDQFEPVSLAAPGKLYAAGVSGAITGKGGNAVVIDDPVKNREEAESADIRDKAFNWYRADLYTRLEDGESIMAILQTRWHEDDLTGRILEEAEKGDSLPWYHLDLPAIALENDPIGREPGEALWPGKVSRERLDEIANVLGPYDFGALYMQRPRPAGSVEFDGDLFGPDVWVNEFPRARSTRVVACDPSLGKEARTGDYTAVVTVCLGQDGLLYVDATLDHWRPERVVTETVAQAAAMRANHVAVEGNLFQELLAPMFLEESKRIGFPVPCELLTNTTNKQIRIRRLGPYLRSRMFRFVRGEGTEKLVEQLKKFPQHKHDDGPDALEMAVRVLVFHDGDAVPSFESLAGMALPAA